MIHIRHTWVGDNGTTQTTEGDLISMVYFPREGVYEINLPSITFNFDPKNKWEVLENTDPTGKWEVLEIS